MDTLVLKIYIRHSLLAILKQTRATYPDNIDADALAMETRFLDAWVDALILTWMD